MSYADATLDLTSISVACLAGANGAGKSALLDAMTWAIWEKGRSNPDDLMRIGQREMWVDLRFEHEGNIYRIRRARQKSRSGKGASKPSLEFQVMQSAVASKVPALVAVRALNDSDMGHSTVSDDTGHGNGHGHGNGDDNGHGNGNGNGHANGNGNGNGHGDGAGSIQEGWRTLTGNSVRDTQRIIDHLLRMDYDTFVNSAYLRQGHADEFTTRPPQKRKEVLAEILGLSYFDRLQEHCKERVRLLRRDRDLLEQMLTRLPELKSNFVDLSEQQSVLNKEMADLAQEKEKWQKDTTTLENRYQDLILTKQKTSSAAEQLSGLAADVESLSEQSDELQRRIKQLDQLLETRGVIEKDIKLYESLRSEVEALDQAALKDASLQNKKVDARSSLSEIRNKLEFEHKNGHETAEKLKSELAKLERDTANSSKVKTEYEEYRHLLNRESMLAQKQEDFTRMTQRINELQGIIDEQRLRLELDLDQKRNAILENEDLLKAKDFLVKRQSELEEQTAEFEKLEAEFERIEQKGLTLKSTKESILLKIENLERHKLDQEGKIAELEECKNSSVCPLCSAPIVDRAAVMARYRSDIEATNKQIGDLHSQTSSIENELIGFRDDYRRTKRTLDGRKELDKERGQFREKQLSMERAEENLRNARKTAETLAARLENNDCAQTERESLLALKEQIAQLEFDPVLYANVQSQIRAQRTIEGRYHQLQRDLTELKKLQDELPVLEKRVAELKATLSEESYGQDVRAQLNELDNQIAVLGYNRDIHSDKKRQFSDLLPTADKFRELKRAIDEKPRLSQSAQNVGDSLKSKQELIRNLQSQVETGSAEIEALPALERELASTKSQFEEVRFQFEQFNRNLAVVNSKRDDTEKEIASLSEKANELADLKQSMDDFSFLAEAFGKKGIQAIIIENAIPEIETDANRILSRLTENQMHVKLETQSENKSGSVIETLDILIGDTVGTRNYELYSGGEAFKVNFSIRVALSRLLARRAGAKLETLIIDEGFGSQDEVSRDRLVRAIRSIQDDFARILVITHFADVKEMFPTHIMVTKHNGCSQVQLLN
jgi:DNA repair protein SbcC/Rad50